MDQPEPRYGGHILKVTCGIDWAEKHHHIALVDETAYW
jgi:hypothetical protein